MEKKTLAEILAEQKAAARVIVDEDIRRMPDLQPITPTQSFNKNRDKTKAERRANNQRKQRSKKHVSRT